MSVVNVPKQKKKAVIWPWVAGATILAIGGGGLWVANKKKFGESIVVTQTLSTKVLEKKNFYLVNIPWVFELIVIPTIKNPSNTKATLTQPYVELRLAESDEAPFSSSQVSAATKTIGPMSEVTLAPIVLKIFVSNILEKAKSILTNALKTRKIGLYTKTTVYLVTAAAKLPIVKPDSTELKF